MMDSTNWRIMPHEADENGDPEGVALKQWLNRHRQPVKEIDPIELGWTPGVNVEGWYSGRHYDLSVPVITCERQSTLVVLDGAHRLALCGLTGRKVLVIVLTEEQLKETKEEFGGFLR